MAFSPVVRELILTEKNYRSTKNGEKTKFSSFKNGIDLLEDDYKEHVISKHSIGKTCIHYRLSCFDLSYFGSDIPGEAWDKIEKLEKTYGIRFSEFKIIAPENIFDRSKKQKDPILLAKIKRGKYLFVHKWGNEFSPLRKIWAWGLKTLEIQTILCIAIGLTVAVMYSGISATLFKLPVTLEDAFLISIASSLSITLLWFLMCFTFKIKPSVIAWDAKLKS